MRASIVGAAVAAAMSSVCPGSVVQSRGGDPCPECEIEVGVLLDHALWTRLGEEAEPAAREILARVHQIFREPLAEGGLGVRIRLGRLTTFREADPWALTTNAEALLDAVRAHSIANGPVPGDGRDLEILITGVDLDGAVVAVTNAGSVCTPDAVGVVDHFTDDTARMAQVVARTIGLMLGAQPDGSGNACDPTGYVMGALGILPATDFSACTQSEVGAFFLEHPEQGACLARERCSDADQAAPFHVLDFSDVFAFLVEFGAGGPNADIQAPFGALDFADVLAFLNTFNAGCP